MRSSREPAFHTALYARYTKTPLAKPPGARPLAAWHGWAGCHGAGTASWLWLCPSASHLPAGLNSGRGGAHLQNNSVSAGGKPEDAAGGGLGCSGRFLGKQRRAEPSACGAGTPFPTHQEEEHTALLMRMTLVSQTPKTFVTNCSLLPTFQAERFKNEHAEFLFLQKLPVPSPPSFFMTVLAICCNRAWMHYSAISCSRCNGAWRQWPRLEALMH